MEWIPDESFIASSWMGRLWERLLSDYSKRLTEIGGWSAFVQHVVDSVALIALAAALIWLIKLLLRRFKRRLIHIREIRYRRKIETVSSLVFSVVKYSIYIASALGVLAIWGVPTESLAVGSAVLGAAVGFGSQGLVQDIITGLSILAEEQLAVGDFVEISGKSGAVEEVGLRVIKLRDHLGVQHVIFNRTISLVSNFTAGAVHAVVDIALENSQSGEAATRVATRICKDLAAELPYFPEVPQVEGVQQSSTNDVFLRINLRVLPQQESVINTLFVDRIKRAFFTENILIPDGRVRVVLLSDLFRKAINKHESGTIV